MKPFIAAHGLKNPHLQTMLPRLLRQKARFQPVWQTLETPDGDFLDLAWSEAWHSDAAQQKPLFILFHGLEGSFHSPYANGLMHAFAQQGWLSVMMHFRGCSGRPNRLARAYHSGEVEDARLFLEHLHTHFPHQPKVAVGVSLGGNMLINYLAHYNHETYLDAACAVSAPLDLAACSEHIEQGFSRLYRTYLLSSLKRTAMRKQPQLQSVLNISRRHIRRLTHLSDFDDLITAPLHGFADAQDYYRRCSGIQFLDKIRLPTQIIHAKDDPFMNEAVIPTSPLPDNIDYHLCKHGGHVGFITGSLRKPRFWLEEALPAYYQHFL